MIFRYLAVVRIHWVPYAIYFKSTQIHPGFYIYTHERSICLIDSIINNIRYNPQGLTGLRPQSGLSVLALNTAREYYFRSAQFDKLIPRHAPLIILIPGDALLSNCTPHAIRSIISWWCALAHIYLNDPRYVTSQILRIATRFHAP